MNRPFPNFGSGRRQFLRDGLRLTLLGGLAAISGNLIARQRVRPSGRICISDGICSGCEAFDDCGLPQALSARSALGQNPSPPP